MKYPSEIRLSALKDYLSGMGIKDLATKYQISEKTLNTWQTREKWVIQKKEAETEIKKNIFEEWRDKAEEVTSKSLSCVQLIVQLALEELLYLKQNNPKPPRNNIRPEVDGWAKTISTAINVQRGIAPEAQQDFAEKILKELKKINERKPLQNEVSFKG